MPGVCPGGGGGGMLMFRIDRRITVLQGNPKFARKHLPCSTRCFLVCLFFNQLIIYYLWAKRRELRFSLYFSFSFSFFLVSHWACKFIHAYIKLNSHFLNNDVSKNSFTEVSQHCLLQPSSHCLCAC